MITNPRASTWAYIKANISMRCDCWSEEGRTNPRSGMGILNQLQCDMADYSESEYAYEYGLSLYASESSPFLHVSTQKEETDEMA